MKLLQAAQKAVTPQQIPQPPVAAENLEADYREPTKAEILSSLETGLRQALDGKGRPARELLDELLNG